MASIQPVQSIPSGYPQGTQVFTLGDRSVERWVLVSSVAGMILIHDIKVGIGRYLGGDEGEHFFGVGEIFREHEVAYQEPSLGDPTVIEDQITDLTMHLLDRGFIHFPVIAYVRIAVGGFRVAVLHIRHVDIDDAIQ
jgi:hypothetical protein